MFNVSFGAPEPIQSVLFLFTASNPLWQAARQLDSSRPAGQKPRAAGQQRLLRPIRKSLPPAGERVSEESRNRKHTLLVSDPEGRLVKAKRTVHKLVGVCFHSDLEQGWGFFRPRFFFSFEAAQTATLLTQFSFIFKLIFGLPSHLSMCSTSSYHCDTLSPSFVF